MVTFRTVVSKVARVYSRQTPRSCLIKSLAWISPRSCTPTRATLTSFPRFFRCTAFCLSIVFNSSLSMRSIQNQSPVRLQLRLSGPRIMVPPLLAAAPVGPHRAIGATSIDIELVPLALRVRGLCPHGKNVKDEARSIHDPHLQHLLDVAKLACR